MQRVIPLAMVGVMLVFTMASASSQQLQQPTPLATKPAAQDNGIGPQLKAAQATKPAEVSGSLDQRSQASSPIPSAGPAELMPAEPAAPQLDLAKPIQPKRILDATGNPVEGTIQVSPDRAYDPATGQYYLTTPSGRPD